jgi:alkanesulfonate monooxygenase SsuD/methylene tetrahydromethanopterin reductase-like flavin-dependent oxidoreductase (luciferase family)
MKHGFVLPSGNARTAAHLAYEAEQAGWDGFFVFEPVWGVDAWVSLTAAAMRTERIRLGTMLSPVSRMRPWKLASETATLDDLSGGRVILSVGLGAIDTGFVTFGEVTDRKQRVELMDEGLDVLTGLWRGQPFSYDGQHYHIMSTEFAPPPRPVQQPRIPIWVVGAWPFEASMRRALRYDGLIPMVRGENGRMRQPAPDELREIAAKIAERRGNASPFDIVVEGTTPADDRAKASAAMREWADAGATWFNEAMWMVGGPDAVEQFRRRIAAGPPRVD